MSKIQQDILAESVDRIIAESKKAKRRFVETVELQVGLKSYDPAKDKRFAGSIVVPHICKRKLRVCIIGDQIHCDQAAKENIPFVSVDDVKNYKGKGNAKKAKQLNQTYDVFFASDSIIKKLPRLMGPSLQRAGKFPTPISHNDNLSSKVDEAKMTVKFQLKKVIDMSCAIGDVSMKTEEVQTNITFAVNFLVSLLKKHWQNIKSIHIKTTMGPAERIY